MSALRIQTFTTAHRAIKRQTLRTEKEAKAKDNEEEERASYGRVQQKVGPRFYE